MHSRVRNVLRALIVVAVFGCVIALTGAACCLSTCAVVSSAATLVAGDELQHHLRGLMSVYQKRRALCMCL